MIMNGCKNVSQKIVKSVCLSMHHGHSSKEWRLALQKHLAPSAHKPDSHHQGATSSTFCIIFIRVEKRKSFHSFQSHNLGGKDGVLLMDNDDDLRGPPSDNVDDPRGPPTGNDDDQRGPPTYNDHDSGGPPTYNDDDLRGPTTAAPDGLCDRASRRSWAQPTHR